jgi:hypothetical protein
MEEESALHTLTYTLSGEIIIRFFFVIYLPLFWTGRMEFDVIAGS